MKQVCFLVILAACLLTPAFSKKESKLVGRWDLTIVSSKGTYPSWLEVSEADGQAKVRVVGRVASVHPANDVRLEGSRLSFATKEWFGRDIQVTWKMSLDGGKLKGTQSRADD